MTITYKIIKGQASTDTDRIKTVWHVVDAADGYIFDTFDLKRDANYWIERATKIFN